MYRIFDRRNGSGSPGHHQGWGFGGKIVGSRTVMVSLPLALALQVGVVQC